MNASGPHQLEPRKLWIAGEARDAASGEILWRRDYSSRFKKGHPYWGASTSPLVDAGPATHRGTRVRFSPDPDVFESVRWHPDVLAARMRQRTAIHAA